MKQKKKKDYMPISCFKKNLFSPVFSQRKLGQIKRTFQAPDLLSLTSSAYNKRTNALDKNLRYNFFSQNFQELNSMRSPSVSSIYDGWRGLKLTDTYTFVKKTPFRKRSYFGFFKEISHNLSLPRRRF